MAKAEQHSRICPGVLIPSGSPWASRPMKIGFLRYGTFHVRPDPLQPYTDKGGCTIKVQGSNVYQVAANGVAVDVDYDPARDARVLDPGSYPPANQSSIAFTNLGWADTGLSFIYPAGTSADMIFPPTPGQGPPVSFDFNWIRIVVSGTGPSGIPLEVWAKFKSGGG